ncbi:hypothetical protein [Lysobacter sp. CCNWLW3]|uniref:hypothetical protein n=1 Tax=Lysobacter sp. CCNWLW3 TaxID=3117014 RepID=UPI002FD0A492
MSGQAKQLAVLLSLFVAFLIGSVIFRDSIGLVVFLLIGVAVLVQTVRVALRVGSGKSLRTLWAAFKDAFWGIG